MAIEGSPRFVLALPVILVGDLGENNSCAVRPNLRAACGGNQIRRNQVRRNKSEGTKSEKAVRLRWVHVLWRTRISLQCRWRVSHLYSYLFQCSGEEVHGLWAFCTEEKENGMEVWSCLVLRGGRCSGNLGLAAGMWMGGFRLCENSSKE